MTLITAEDRFCYIWMSALLTMEFYVDGLMAKTWLWADNTDDLQEVFSIVRKYGMRLKLKSSSLGSLQKLRLLMTDKFSQKVRICHKKLISENFIVTLFVTVTLL